MEQWYNPCPLTCSQVFLILFLLKAISCHELLYDYWLSQNGTQLYEGCEPIVRLLQKKQKLSTKLTFPSLMDFTSVPINTMPASYLSSTKYS